MPRIIFKCPYLKPDAGLPRGGYTVYVATREGVEVIPSAKRTLPASQRQRQLIEKLLSDFPDAEEYFEYEDFINNPTMGTASEFITRTLEDALGDAAGREGYVQYMAKRPRVERVGGHGLFGAADGPVNLARVSSEISSHPGNVWVPIISLRREDADRLGYSDVKNWHAFLKRQADVIAKNLRIDVQNLVWYAAFHNESHHPHVHMLCYAKEPRNEYLTKAGIRNIKSALARDIFRNELTEVYERQTQSRKEVGDVASTALREALGKLQNGVWRSGEVTTGMTSLVDKLRFHNGKKVYGYLRPPVRELVDRIVDELAKEPRVAAAYAVWCGTRQEVLESYRKNPSTDVPLSQNEVFKPIRNMVVREAVNLLEGRFTFEQAPEPEIPETDVPQAPPNFSDGGDDPQPSYMRDSTQADQESSQPAVGDGSVTSKPFAKWTDEYLRALPLLYGTKTFPPNYDDAYEQLLAEAESGNALAMYDIGKMYARGLGREIDAAAAEDWYTKALDAFQIVEQSKPAKGHCKREYVQYRIGKMHHSGLGTEENCEEAAHWYKQSAGKEYKYAQYSLGCLYRDGKGVPQDHERAFSLFRVSAEQTFPYASFECGKMLRDGIGVAADGAEAALYFQEAFMGFQKLEAERSDDNLQYRIGWMLLTGTGVAADKQLATAHFEKAAQQGNTLAQYQLAKLILAEQDPDPYRFGEAVMWMTKAAQAGSDVAQYALGKLFLSDERIADVDAGVHWLTMAATPQGKNPCGNSYAQYRLGKLLLEGTLVPRDAPAAIRWLEKAADQNNSFAQYALGMALLCGEGAGEDILKAVSLLTAAADQGNNIAAYQLGKLYLAGEKLPVDVARGLQWMTSAAEAGNAVAQYALGKFYLFGDAEHRDAEAAIHWLTLSAAQGNIYATFLLQQHEDWIHGAKIMAATRLLNGVGQIFSSGVAQPVRPGSVRFEIDRKRRRELQQKKDGKGIAQSEQEQQIEPM